MWARTVSWWRSTCLACMKSSVRLSVLRKKIERDARKEGSKEDIAIDSILWQYIYKHVHLQNNDLGNNVIATSFKTFHTQNG